MVLKAESPTTMSDEICLWIDFYHSGKRFCSINEIVYFFLRNSFEMFRHSFKHLNYVDDLDTLFFKFFCCYPDLVHVFFFFNKDEANDKLEAWSPFQKAGSLCLRLRIGVPYPFCFVKS